MVSGVATIPIELSAGQWLDGYELVHPLARGGMAQVWLAKLHGRHGFEKLVALKTILPVFAQQARFRRMFVEEAKILAGIEHVNVAHILNLGEQDGVLYLAMEWVDGDSLQELEAAAQRAARTLPFSVLTRVMADVCAGLHAAHELRDSQGKLLNVVHRDVSPQNILISSGGIVKLIDFGVVKARQRGSEDTAKGTIKGKLQYMAPEQALGHALDRRADIWSVGAILYRLLARRPLFPSSGPLSTFKRLISPEPPEPLPSSVPTALSSIVLKALAFDPAHRYATAAELGAALEALLWGPNQTSSRDVVACMERYLGGALAARRQALGRALLACAPAEPTQPYRRESSGEAASVSRLGGVPSSPLALVSLPAADRRQAPAESALLEPLPAPEEPTRPRGGVLASCPRPGIPRRGQRAVAAAGLLALGSSVFWAIVSSGAHVPMTLVVERAASTEKSQGRRIGVRPSSPAPAASSPASPAAVAAPSAEQAPPLQLQALPLLSETASPREPSLVVEPPSSPPKRKAKRGALSPPRKGVVSQAAASPRPVAAADIERRVVDDGF